MKDLIVVLLFFAISCQLAAQENPLKDKWKGGNMCDTSKWVLIFNDEFDGNRLDNSKWYTFYPNDTLGKAEDCRVRNKEDQIYLDGNVIVEEGILKLITKKEEVSWGKETRNHSSGMVYSKDIFRDYGRFEIRCKIPKGMGYWPAFWLFGWSTEVDIFEFGGHRPRQVHMQVIKWGKDKWIANSKKKKAGKDYSKDFHTFAYEYNENVARFFVDGKEKFVVSRLVKKNGKSYKKCELDEGEYDVSRSYQRYNDPLNLIVNTAVAFDKGSFTNAPNKKTKFPGVFEVDYVRVYKRK